MSDADAAAVVKAWFDADFEGGRHQRRVEKIEEMEHE
jgi:ribose 5-phosphate isomerase B